MMDTATEYRSCLGSGRKPSSIANDASQWDLALASRVVSP